MKAARTLRRQLGATLLEVLITLVISAFGLLGLAGFVSRATTLSMDSVQRARALTLANDMASRMRSNKTNSDTYWTAATHGASVATCGGLVGTATRDLCEWSNLLAGAQDAQSGGNSAFLGFRGCILRTEQSPKTYVITVAWGSVASGKAPSDTCAKDVFGSDEYRKVVRVQVRIAQLGSFIAPGTP